MSTNLNYKQATNVKRRTWDAEAYEARAKARAAAEAAGEKKNDSNNKPEVVGEKRDRGEEEEKEEFTPAAKGAAKPYQSDRAFLKARRGKVDLESKVGTSEIVSAEAVATSSSKPEVMTNKDAVTKTGVGWYCKVCDCFLKDSHTYLDHINGRKHQRKLGYSMRIAKSTKDEIKAKLAQLSRAEEERKKPLEEEDTNFESIVKSKDEELSKRKEERAKRREERKKKQQEEEEEEEDEPAMDPAMAAMMGFSSFGGSNKN